VNGATRIRWEMQGDIFCLQWKETDRPVLSLQKRRGLWVQAISIKSTFDLKLWRSDRPVRRPG
jgi:hypothetical protein